MSHPLKLKFAVAHGHLFWQNNFYFKNKTCFQYKLLSGSSGWMLCSQEPGHRPNRPERGGQSRVHRECPTQTEPSWVQGPPREPRQGQHQMGPETGLDTRLQQKSKVHPGERARAGLVARLMAQLRQGLKAQGRDETGQGVQALGRLLWGQELCSGPWQLQLPSSILAPKSWEHHTVLPFI